MKLNKSKNKGKVHPSPSSSPSSSAINNVDDPISSLNHLLPTAILTLISILSLQDREALAYMITHSLKSSTLNYCSSSNFDQKIKRTPNKKSSSSSSSIIATTANHSSPCFDCCCFDCFSHFWNRWDSSPHSELIHQAIEAFEEHLSSTEKTKTTSSKKTKNNNGKSSSRKKNRMVSSADVEERESCVTPEILISAVVDDDIKEESSKINEVKEEVWSPEILVMADVEERENEENLVSGDGEDAESGARKELQQQQQQQQHKGLARKVLPDVIGLFHSRFWKNLWGPNV